MRKTLLIVLAVALALLLCAGCNNIRRVDDDDSNEEPITIVIGGISDGDSDDDSDEGSDDDSDEETYNDSNVDNDKPDSSTPIELPTEHPPSLEEGELPNVWPAGHLPQGFPEYPDGDIGSVKVNADMSLHIVIEESSQETFGEYIVTLRDAGWQLERLGDERVEGWSGIWDYELWGFEKDGVSGDIEFCNPYGWVEILIY